MTDFDGKCLIADVNTDSYIYHVQLDMLGGYNCKLDLEIWSLSLWLFLFLQWRFPFYYLLYIQDCNNFGQCRWSTNPDEPLLFVRHYYDRLNILDAEKKTSTLKESIRLSENCNFSRIFALYPLHLLLIQNKIILNSTVSAGKCFFLVLCWVSPFLWWHLLLHCN